MEKGRALALLERYSEALQCLEEAARVSRWWSLRKFTEFDTLKAATLSKMGLREEAMALFEHIVSRDAQHAPAWYSKGLAHCDWKEFDAADRCFSKAVDLAPEFSRAWTDKGAVLARAGKLEDALTCYDRATQADARYALAWRNKGNALVRLRRTAEAVDCYETAYGLDPTMTDVKAARDALVSQMIADGTLIVELPGTPRVEHKVADAIRRGMELDRHEEWIESIGFYDQALTINGACVAAWSLKGNALLQLRRLNEALLCFDRALELDEAYPQAWVGRGETLAGLARFDEAKQSFESFLRWATDDLRDVVNLIKLRVGQLDEIGKLVREAGVFGIELKCIDRVSFRQRGSKSMSTIYAPERVERRVESSQRKCPGLLVNTAAYRSGRRAVTPQ
jgi:tetratricopeptide (TPR) repeat protein